MLLELKNICFSLKLQTGFSIFDYYGMLKTLESLHELPKVQSLTKTKDWAARVTTKSMNYDFKKFWYHNQNWDWLNTGLCDTGSQKVTLVKNILLVFDHCALARRRLLWLLVVTRAAQSYVVVWECTLCNSCRLSRVLSIP